MICRTPGLLQNFYIMNNITSKILLLVVFVCNFSSEIHAAHSNRTSTEDDFVKRLKTGDAWLIASISIGSAAILLIIVLVCCCCCPSCKFSKPKPNENDRSRRSSSFRFNRASAPSAPMLMEESSSGVPRNGNFALQSSVTNDPLGGYTDLSTDPTAPYPPAYSTLPSSGHTSISIPTIDESADATVHEDHNLPTSGNTRGLQRSETTVSEVWYDASTVSR